MIAHELSVNFGVEVPDVADDGMLRDGSQQLFIADVNVAVQVTIRSVLFISESIQSRLPSFTPLM